METDRKVTKEEAEAFSREQNMEFKELSALSGKFELVKTFDQYFNDTFKNWQQEEDKN